jgi:hypothetical protein
MMVGATTIATTAQQGSDEAAKLRQRRLRPQNGGGRQSENAEQEGSARNASNASNAIPVGTNGRIAHSLAIAHGNDPNAILDAWANDIFR